MSDGPKAFRAAMEARGYYLAQGDRRGFVAVDWRGEIYAVSRYAGIKTKEVRNKLGEPEQLPTVAETKERIAKEARLRLRAFKSQLKQVSTAEQNPTTGAEQKSASLGCAPWSERLSNSKHGPRRIGRQANSLSFSFGR